MQEESKGSIGNLIKDLKPNSHERISITSKLKNRKKEENSSNQAL
jgi:hypothetical protein